MVEIIRLQDPVARAVEYLGFFVPHESGPFLDVPPDWEWGKLLVTVADVGGEGERDVVLDDARLMVEVSHEDSLEASHWCRNIHGLLKHWRANDPTRTVSFLKTVQRPTYTPDDESRTPAYSTIVDLSFRADRHDVPKISDS
jgi:hypothetical protein